MAPDAPPSDPLIAEWNAARSVIDKIDDRLNDLRKYGLTFVTGLLTAQAIVDSAPPSSNTYVVPGVKLAIILASLVLICALYVIEMVNRQVQHAAASRARSIEKARQLGLTRAIAKAFAIFHVSRFLDLVYAMMVVATGVLGFFVMGAGAVKIDSSTVAVVAGATAAEILILAIHLMDKAALREFGPPPVIPQS